MRLKIFLDVEITGEDREKRDSYLACFGEITHFKRLNSCIGFCFGCNNNIEVIFALLCGKKPPSTHVCQQATLQYLKSNPILQS